MHRIPSFFQSLRWTSLWAAVAVTVVLAWAPMAVQAAPPDAGKLSLWSGQAPVGDGVTGIVLEYRLPCGRSFVPLLDAQRAIRTVRFNAKQWNINPARIGIIGFSAGGHLASTAGGSSGAARAGN